MKRIVAYFFDDLLEKYKSTRKEDFSIALKAKVLSAFDEESVTSFNVTLNTAIIDLELDDANGDIKNRFLECLELNEDEVDGVLVSVYSYNQVEESISINTSSKKDFKKYIEKIDELKKELTSKVYGQHHAIDEVIGWLIDQYIFDNNDEGIRTFTFCGPHAVGKTYMARIIADFYKEEFNVPNRFLSRSDYEDVNLFDDLKRFVGNNPKSIIVFNDAEDFYKFINERLPELFNSGYYENVSFKNVLFFFTTCLGRPVYSSSLSGNLSNVSKDAICNALLTDNILESNIGYFTESVARGLAKGACVMFNFLDLYTIHEIIENRIEEKFKRFEESTGISVKYNKKQFVTAAFYMNTGEYNVKSLSKCIDQLVQNELNDIFSQNNPKNNQSVLTDLKKINFDFSFEDASEEVTRLFEERKLTGLIICNEDEAKKIKKLNLKNINFNFATSAKDARSVFQNNADFIIIDVLFDLDNLNRMPTNIEDYDNEGIKLFNHIINYNNEPAIYILNNKKFNKKYSDYAYLISNGAKDVLFFDEKATDELESELIRIQKSIELELDIEFLITNKKILVYNSKQYLSKDGLSLDVLFSRLALMYCNHKYTNSSLISYSNAIKFKDFIGNQHAVNVLMNYVSFLKNPTMYLKQAIKSPKGVLICGPKGVGKKSLVNALANETNVSFVSQNVTSLINETDSDKEAMKIIHELFAKAKNNSPAVLMFDDVDSLAEETDNAAYKTVIKFLKSEIEAINNDDKHPVVFICTSTMDKEYLNENFVNTLDRVITMNLPSLEEKEMYITQRFSGYSLDNISASAISNVAARLYNTTLGQINNFIEFVIKNARGEELNDRVLLDTLDMYEYGDETENSSNEENLKTAYHEVGHWLIQYLCGKHPTFITIVSRGNYGGYTSFDLKRKEPDEKRQDLLDKICCSFGGRVAETIFYGDEGINSGASSDLASATATARYMICSLGMGNSLIAFNSLRVSEMPAFMIEEIDKVLKEQYDRCYKYLSDEKDLIEYLAKHLVKVRFLTGEEVEKLVTDFKNKKKK